MALAIITTLIQKTARSLAEKTKLGLLNALLWGGVILLAVEHIWHGEVTPWPPFLTAMATPSGIPVMLHEMATIGLAMSAVTTVTWGAILAICHYMPKIAALETMKMIEKTFTTAKL
jgi:formate-dependent phosphoribosylglycinamide formyltransferase (GAR transformylase)